MAVWNFSIEEKTVKHGNRQRIRLTPDGCNEPFKGRYWCPKRKWFNKEACPFTCSRECENYKLMCGTL